MSLVSLVKWNVSLSSADVSWRGVRAIRTAAKETTADTIHKLILGKAGDSAPKIDASTPQITLASPISAKNCHKNNKSMKPDKFPLHIRRPQKLHDKFSQIILFSFLTIFRCVKTRIVTRPLQSPLFSRNVC